jgi:glycosyltransferase involved in cell wall biosynthesis
VLCGSAASPQALNTLLAPLPPAARARVQLAGFVRGAALLRHYRECALYVAPTRYESFGYSVLEAMASGRPVLASDLPALRELIEDGVNGRLVPAGDLPALQAGLCELLSNPDRAEAYGRAARESADRFGLETIMQRQIAWYRQAVEAT